MGFYARVVFPRLMEATLGRFGDVRAAGLAEARGDVLEVGFGTGLNLPHYPPAVASLAAIDPIEALPSRVAARVAAAPFAVERLSLRADGRLPVPDGCFDTIVTTWTLCSIPDVGAALGEMRRVLRPDGRYLFVEHGRSADGGVARWQRWLTPIQRRIGCGCRLDLPIDDVIRSAGFELERIERFVQPGEPRIFATLYRGAARRG